MERRIACLIASLRGMEGEFRSKGMDSKDPNVRNMFEEYAREMEELGVMLEGIRKGRERYAPLWDCFFSFRHSLYCPSPVQPG